MSWLGALGLLLGACGEDPPPPPSGPPPPPPADSLSTIDLCEGGDTAALLREHLRQGGPAAVTGWLRDHVTLPANVRYCDRVAGPTTHTQAMRMTVSRVIGAGGASGVLLEQGPPLADLPLGMRLLSFDVFPEDGTGADAEGVRVVFVYAGE